MELQTVDLASVGTNEKKPVEFAGQPRLVILDNHPSVELRLNQRGAPALPAVRGDEYCLEEGIGKVYVTNPLQVEADLRLLVLRQDEVATLESEAGVNGGGSVVSIAQERLTGNLAENESIDSGESLAETVGTEGADRVRVRARTGGLASFSNTNDWHPAALGTAQDVELDAENDRVFVPDQDGQVHEADVSAPDSPTLEDSITPTGFTDAWAVALDDVNDKLLVLGTDGTDTLVAVLDVSTVGTMSEDGTVVVVSGTSSVVPGRMNGEAYPPLNKVYFSDPREDRTLEVEYSTPASPTKVAELVQDHDGGNSAIRVDRSEGWVIISHNVGGGFDQGATLWLIRDGSKAVNVSILTFGPGEDNDSMAYFGYDEDRKLAWISQGDATDLISTADASLTLVASDVVGDQGDAGGGVGEWSYDAEEQLLFGSGPLDDFWIFNVQDPENPVVVESVGSFTGGWGPDRPTVYHRDVDAYFVPIRQEGLQTVSGDPGLWDLKVYSLNPAGNRNQDPVADVSGQSEEELRADLDLVGEESVDVEIVNRSGQQGTIEYADIYQEPV